MSNPLFGLFNGQNNMLGMLQNFMQFKNAFRGNAQQEVEKILSSGRFSQQDINQAQNMARQLQQIMEQMK